MRICNEICIIRINRSASQAIHPLDQRFFYTSFFLKFSPSSIIMGLLWQCKTPRYFRNKPTSKTSPLLDRPDVNLALNDNIRNYYRTATI